MNKKGMLTADNAVYVAHFIRPNFGYAEISYMLGTLSAIYLHKILEQRV
jgi:hypothetical protein